MTHRQESAMSEAEGSTMTPEGVERLKEIIRMAQKLGWINPRGTSYPIMQLSEVEKCMLAMADDKELQRMREWVEE